MEESLAIKVFAIEGAFIEVMTSYIWHTFLRDLATPTMLWSLLLGGLLGCGSLSGRRTYSDDPLLLSRKPVEGKIGTFGPVMLAYAEPSPPPLPAEAFVFGIVPSRLLPNENSPQFAKRRAGPKEADSLAQSTTSRPGDLAISPRNRPPVAALQVARRKSSGIFDHAADYSWLQGILEQDEAGVLVLHYGDPTTQDNWGGKLRLEEDNRLGQFGAGDIILAEGEVVIEPGPSIDAKRTTYPRYRIRNLWLVQPKS